MPLPGSRPGTHATRKPSVRPTPPKPSIRPSKPLANRPEKPSINRPGKPSIRPPKPLASHREKPSARPSNRLGASNRPEHRPGLNNRPSTPPSIGARPGTRPGLGNRPGSSNRPGLGNRPGSGSRPSLGNRPGSGNRPGFGNRPVHRPGSGLRPVQRPPLNRPGYGQLPNRPGQRPWWKPGHRPGMGHGNGHIGINDNFRHSLNWSTHHNHWGYNPWWCRPACRPWYGGSWHCGWHPAYYYHYPYWPGYCSGEIIGWGLAAWSLGTLIYDTGYSSYYNPYPTTEIITYDGGYVDYSEPITNVAAESLPANDAQIVEITEKSESLIERSQEAFRQQNYLLALDYANKAIAEAPGDGALHEYRALVLFALAKYSEAAGVLNPVLASGPGWDWTTMIKLYESSQTYTDQLRKLEQYTVGEQLEIAVELQPADSVSRQLAALASVSAPDNVNGETGGKTIQPSAAAIPAPEPAADPVPPENLAGVWVADKGAEGKIILALAKDGTFAWTYAKPDAKPFELKGKYKLNEKGMLVLEGGNSQMVANISMPEDDKMNFVLAAGPPGDPGLVFEKK